MKTINTQATGMETKPQLRKLLSSLSFQEFFSVFTCNLIIKSCCVQEVSSECDVSVGSDLHFRKM
jgi:hypothetical protein